MNKETLLLFILYLFFIIFPIIYIFTKDKELLNYTFQLLVITFLFAIASILIKIYFKIKEKNNTT
jgi:Na+-driven multidrug efflux pump